MVTSTQMLLVAAPVGERPTSFTERGKMNDNNTMPLGVHQTPRSYDIFAVLKQERRYQTAKWGNDTDDTMNSPTDFVSYISRYSTGWMSGEFAPYSTKTVDEFRISMLKTAALAIAA